MIGLYAPNADEVRAVAEQAALSNPHKLAKQWLLDKLDTPSGDWDARFLLSVPGPVWTVASDTCETGRLEAPKNIAYDDLGREFVYRQPAGPDELAAIMSADACEVFACYRFDGLRRWTRTSLSAWHETHNVLLGWVKNLLRKEPSNAAWAGLDELLSYQTSGEFNMYLTALHDHLGGQIYVEPRRP